MPIHRGPGRERDPDVIERMVTKYIFTLNSQPEDCRDATLAMREAVVELQSIVADRQLGEMRARLLIADVLNEPPVYPFGRKDQ